jgi:monoamine oxidase
VTRVASHVLLAIPFTLLRDVRLDLPLPAVKRRAIAELGYGANSKLMVGVRDRVWRTTHRSNGSTLSDLPCQLTWETSRGQPGRAGILTNFTGGRQALSLGTGTAAAQAERLAADVERIYPGFTAARAGMREARMHWPTFPWARGSYAGYRTGQWTGIAGAEAEPVGRLYFAGEHCSRAAQGYMEGGCETGEQAAAAITRALGVRVPARVGAARRTARVAGVA